MDLNDLVDSAPAKPKRYSLWRFFNTRNELLYVSQKPNPAILMTYDWWFDTHHVSIVHFSSMDDLIDEKSRAIYNENPKWNSIGRRTDIS